MNRGVPPKNAVRAKKQLDLQSTIISPSVAPRQYSVRPVIILLSSISLILKEIASLIVIFFAN